MCKGGDQAENLEEGGEGNRQQWFKYDDESVKLIDDIESQMLSTQKAYILFYQKVDQGDQDLSDVPPQQQGLIRTPVKQALEAAKPVATGGKVSLELKRQPTSSFRVDASTALNDIKI